MSNRGAQAPFFYFMKFTKLRYIKSKSPDELSMALEKLKFKVKIKQVYFAQGFHWVWFTLTDTDQMENIEL